MIDYSFQELSEILMDYAKCGFNVLLEGTHGVGKSSLIEQVFKNMGWNYLILNTPTTDPYRDLCGIPEVVVRNQNDKTERVLLSVLPEMFAQDSLDALFLDEINRSSPEILNSLMELIQFKKVSGKKLNKLKVVWAAENPYNPQLGQHSQIYYVKPLDPAQKDRFHAFFTLRAEVDAKFLKTKFSNVSNSEPIIDEFVNWWKEMTEEQKQYCSPRRIEYALSVYFAMKKNTERLYDVLGDWGELNNPLPNLIESLNKINDENHQQQEKQQLQNLYKTLNNNHGNINQIIGLHNVHLFARLIIDGMIPQSQWLNLNRDVKNAFAKKYPDLLKKVESGRKNNYTLEYAIRHIINRDALYDESELANGSFTKVLLEIFYLNKQKRFPTSDKSLIDCFIQYSNLNQWASLFQSPIDHVQFKKISDILNKMQQNSLNILCFALLCQNLDNKGYLLQYISNGADDGNIYIDRGKWFSVFWEMKQSELETILTSNILTPESELINSDVKVDDVIRRWRIEPPENYRQPMQTIRKI